MSTRPPSRTGALHEGDRPTLPPIHSLFGSELAQPARPRVYGTPSATYSPSAQFSRLNVDDEGAPYVSNHARHYSIARPQSRAQGAGPPPALSVPQTLGTPYPTSFVPPSSRGHGHSRSLDGSPYDHPQSLAGVDRPRSSSSPSYVNQHPYVADPQTSRYSSRMCYGSRYEDQRGQLTHRPYTPGDLVRPVGVVQPAPSSGPSPASYPYGVPTSLNARTEIALPPSTGENPLSAASRYECQYCRKGFTRPSSLRIHVYSHTGERPFKCTFDGCDRTFSVQSNMRRHARTHTQPAAPDVQETSEDDESEGSARGSSSGRM